MDANSLKAADAYTNALTRINEAGSGGDALKSGKQDETAFASMLERVVSDTTEATQTAEKVSAQAVAGEADLVDVVTSVSNAEMVLDTVVTVRDRVIQAYNDIIKMPI